MINALHTIALYVRDQDRSKRFYVEDLGFDCLEDEETPGGRFGRWIEVGPHGSDAAFLLADGAAWGKADRIGSSADITLRCTDARELFEQLSRRGVAVTQPQTQRFGTFVDVTDPDGHVLRVVGLEGRTIPDREGPAT